MRPTSLLLLTTLVPTLCLSAESIFTKRKLDSFFYAEGAAIADFTGDGRPDVAAGPRVFIGPDFQKSRVYRSPHAFDRLSYSNNFLTFTDDFNDDGRPDILVIGWPGKEAFWFENPGEKVPSDWVQHLAYFNVDSESPGFADLNGDGRAEIVAGSGGRLGYMQRDSKDATAAWTFHPITPPGKWQRYTHGIGLGDVNGDGVNDVVTSIAAHGYGLSWFEQKRAASGESSWIEHAVTSRKAEEKLGDVQFSQPHAVMLVDMDGDGLKDIVTGKRHWAHGDKGDPEPNAPAVLYWFKLARGSAGVTFTPHLIDNDSGVGCQFPIADLDGNGKPDIAIANKKGVFVFTQ